MDLENMTIKDLREVAKLASALAGTPCSKPSAATGGQVKQQHLWISAAGITVCINCGILKRKGRDVSACKGVGGPMKRPARRK